MKHLSAIVIAFGLLLAPDLSARQKPATTAEKEAAEQKAAAEAMAKMAAQQAEAVARAQQKVAEEARRKAIEAAREEEAKASVVVPIDLEVVISRYQGDKKTSSLPYALTVNAVYAQTVNDISRAQTTSLRMGGEVPLPATSTPLGPNFQPIAGITGGGPVQYKAVGTNIDARGRILEGGRFELWISVQDDAIATPQGVGAAASAPTDTLPVIRTFRASNNVILRDGQTRQFTAAADRITGEVVKVDVTLKVAK